MKYRFLYMLPVLVFFSCKKEKNDSKRVSLSIEKENVEVEVKQIVFDREDFTFIISLSNNKTYEFEALELLYDSSTSFKRIDSDSFKFGNGDHYGNHISMFFDFNMNDKTLYLKKLKAFLPFKQDSLGRNKYCTMDNLNMDIRNIDGDQLFDQFNSDKYCELRE